MNCQWWYYWCGAKLKKFRHEIFVFVFDTLWDWKEKVNINSKYYLLIEMKSRAKTNSCKSNLPDSAYLFSFDCRINYWIFLFLSFFLSFFFSPLFICGCRFYLLWNIDSAKLKLSGKWRCELFILRKKSVLGEEIMRCLAMWVQKRDW